MSEPQYQTGQTLWLISRWQHLGIRQARYLRPYGKGMLTLEVIYSDEETIVNSFAKRNVFATYAHAQAAIERQQTCPIPS